MSKKMKNKEQVATVSSTSSSPDIQDSVKNNEEKVLVLGKWIAKIFKVTPEKANLISKTILSLTGTVVSMVAIILSLLKGLGVI